MEEDKRSGRPCSGLEQSAAKRGRGIFHDLEDEEENGETVVHGPNGDTFCVLTTLKQKCTARVSF